MDWKDALKNLNNSKVVTILYLEELKTIAQSLSNTENLENKINELASKLRDITQEINKSENVLREKLNKANDFDKLCDLIFQEDGYLWDSIHFNWVEKEKNPDGYAFVKDLVEKWRREKKIVNGK